MVDPTANPYGKYNGREAEYALRMLSGEDDGDARPWPQRLEEAFAKKHGVKYAVACNSGTSALHMALFAAGVGHGDEVIVPALTVVMDSYAAIFLGATPVFVDVDESTFNIDPEDVKRKITKRTKAIVAVDLYGVTADIKALKEIAAEYDICVVEDAAQAMLEADGSCLAGTMADIGVFSLEAKKHMTSGSEGGMLISNDEHLATQARKFGGIGYKHMTASAGRTHLALSTVQDPSYERFDTIGLNYRMNEISAAVGLGQLERLEEMVSRRQAVGKMFYDASARCNWFLPQTTPEGYVNSYFSFAVNYQGERKRSVSWREFYTRYVDAGGDGFYGAWVIPYLEPALIGKTFGTTICEPGICPVSEKLQSQMMQFKSNYRDLQDAQNKANILRDVIDQIGR